MSVQLKIFNHCVVSQDIINHFENSYTTDERQVHSLTTTDMDGQGLSVQGHEPPPPWPGMLVQGEGPDGGTGPLGKDVRSVASCFNHFSISKGLPAFTDNKVFGVEKMEKMNKNVINPLKRIMIFYVILI